MPNKKVGGSSIRVLEPHLINQIASGQVVDRPASVVKELVENALDAGATQVDVALQDGGQSLIRVTDNGHGMSLEDLQLCVERHATSKLPDGDLFRIQTFGFRGEALPSIGAVARLRITSRLDSAEAAWSLAVEGSVRSPPAPSTFLHPSGTKVEVEDLFFATPARLKFMKSTATELSHVQDILQRLALANPQVAFRLTDGPRELFTYAAAQATSDQELLTQRAEAVLGATFCASSLPVAVQREDYQLNGLMGVPTYHRGTAAQQYVFVNGRVVRDRGIAALIRQAYQDLMPKERHAVGVLFVLLPPEDVDMNVHPAKTEVRFRDLARVRSLVLGGLKQALQTSGLCENQALSEQTLQAFSGVGNGAGAGAAPSPSASFSRGMVPALSYAPPQPHLWQAREAHAAFRTGSQMSGNLARVEKPIEQDIGLDIQPEQGILDGLHAHPLGVAIGQIHQSYIVAQTPDSLVLVDQHAAHERLAYEAMKQQLARGQVLRKPLLIPEIVHLTPLAIAALQQHFASLAQFGFVLETFGDDGILIREIPEMLAMEQLTTLLQDLAAELATLDLPETALDKLRALLQEIAGSRACRGSIKAGHALSLTEMNALLRQMESTPHTEQCNHGRPTFIRLQLKDLERLFGRHD